uniref:Uncharacterized protein n=1 Tax=Trypanosoma congolense (strain IL3000) TaxID=1068625 RepID=G0ULX2_TRYCI|nr:hypothetical protein, unlikely [Trypanosoma congolense IL3000]
MATLEKRSEKMNKRRRKAAQQCTASLSLSFFSFLLLWASTRWNPFRLSLLLLLTVMLVFLCLDNTFLSNYYTVRGWRTILFLSQVPGPVMLFMRFVSYTFVFFLLKKRKTKSRSLSSAVDA